MPGLNKTICELLNRTSENVFGFAAKYTRGTTEIDIIVIPSDTWDGVLTGELAYNVNRSLWALDNSKLIEAGLQYPQVGDTITVLKSAGSEVYKVIKNTDNKVFTSVHGLNDNQQITVTTQKTAG